MEKKEETQIPEEMPEMTLPKGMYTNEELDALSGMIVVFLHAVERTVRMVASHYEAEYRAKDEYKRYCKMYGQSVVEARLGKVSESFVRNDERNKIGLLIRRAESFLAAMEPFTERTVSLHRDDVSTMENFDALMNDANLISYLYALYANCPGEKDALKIVSTMKILAKRKTISQRLLDQLAEGISY